VDWQRKSTDKIMRAVEFIHESSGCTTSGAIASVSHAIGEVNSRQMIKPPTKYANAYEKPWASRKIKNARR